MMQPMLIRSLRCANLGRITSVLIPSKAQLVVLIQNQNIGSPIREVQGGEAKEGIKSCHHLVTLTCIGVCSNEDGYNLLCQLQKCINEIL